MGKPVARQALAADLHLPPLPHQAVALLQLPRQLPQQLPFSNLLYAGNNLGREIFPLYTGHRQDLTQIVFQPADTLFDHTFDPGRQRSPVQHRSLNPAARFVLQQALPFLHIPQ